MTQERPPQDTPPPGSTTVRCDECGAVLPDARALLLHIESAHVRGNL